MLTIKRMLKVTPAKIFGNAQQVKILKVKQALRKDGKIVFFYDTRTDVEKYLTMIMLTGVPDKGRLTKRMIQNAKAHVSCGCAFFKYYCERALVEKGSASRRFTRGVEPGSGPTGMEVNPRLIPYVCKHIITGVNNMHRIQFKQKGNLSMDQEMELAMLDIDKYIPEKYDRARKPPKVKTKKPRR